MGKIDVSEDRLILMEVKAKDTDLLTLEEVDILLEWVYGQEELIDLSLAEVLDIYRLTNRNGFIDWLTWLDVDEEHAIEAFNSVVSEENKIYVETQTIYHRIS